MTDSFFSDEETGAQKPYVVLARKYRPQTFEDLIGQDAMVATLRNAFQQGRIAQGYMLTGVRGVGKTTTARILARALNFEPKEGREGPAGPLIDLPREPGAYGRHCAEIMESRHADVVEMDAASNTGVDNVREIIESARYKPMVARYKVFIIDEVHMLSKGAFNALLKTLEEPPEHVKFIFATTEIRKVPVTVLSRCQRFDLRRVDVPLLTGHFARIVEAEGAKAEEEALRLIARAAGGSVRDGLSILDQAIAFSQGEVQAGGVRAMLGLADRGRIFDLLDALISGEAAYALEQLGALHSDGAEPVQALTDLAEAVHLATRIKVAGAEAGAEAVSAEERRRAEAAGSQVSMALLSRYWQMLTKGIEEAARSPTPLAAAEMVLIRVAYTADLPSPDDILRALGGQGAPSRRPGTGVAPAAANGSGSGSGKARAEARAEAGSGNADPASAPNSPLRPAHPVAGTAAPKERAERSQRADGTAPAAPIAVGEAVAPPPPSPEDYGADWDIGADDPGAFGGEAAFDLDDPVYEDAQGPASGGLMPDPASFQDVVALIGAKRDAKLKYHLEENASLVKFDRTARSIDLYLLPAAPPEIANELREKLNQWTGKKWFVMLSRKPGERPLAEVERERTAKELERLKADPVVAALFEVFPDAEVKDVRDLPGEAVSETDPHDDTATG